MAMGRQSQAPNSHLHFTPPHVLKLPVELSFRVHIVLKRPSGKKSQVFFSSSYSPLWFCWSCNAAESKSRVLGVQPRLSLRLFLMWIIKTCSHLIYYYRNIIMEQQ